MDDIFYMAQVRDCQNTKLLVLKFFKLLTKPEKIEKRTERV